MTEQACARRVSAIGLAIAGKGRQLKTFVAYHGQALGGALA